MIGGPLRVVIRVRRDLATKRSGRTLSRPNNTRRGLERVHELDNRLVPIFLRGLDDACRGRQHEFHTLREPSVRVSRLLSLFGCFASVLPAAS